MSTIKYYQYCSVPLCENNTNKTPEKLFIPVPHDKNMRKKWMQLARRDWKKQSIKSMIYFCEDHFDLSNDMDNYMQYRIQGFIKKIRMKEGCLPSRFTCQPDRKRTAPSADRNVIVKRQRKALIEEILKDTDNNETSVCTKGSENNEEYGKLPRRGENIELEKFKRRLIRAVARMLLHEKRNEDEVWAGLKKETGCDCKELWSRMHALTIKKLEYLLKVQDRVDLLPKAARMSITDWLMFDTVLVHEDFDVIGMTETSTEDKKMLVDLFELVEKYKIEFLAGDELTDAWLQVTLEYNNDDRQCTPMLLQRRWYQLKLATRARFYKFWSMYKGVVKRQYLGEPYKPTALQAKIALRYKPLVIRPFMFWEDLIKNKLVILPEEFERKEITMKPVNSAEIEPDVLCVEPAVETIDLDSDSDLELEYRTSEQKDDQNDRAPPIAVKQEPKDIDENTPYENRQEKILHFAEAVMEATAMELDEIELADDIDGFLCPEPGVQADIPLNNYNKDPNHDVQFSEDDTAPSKVAPENNASIVTVTENASKVNANEVDGNLLIGNECETNSINENVKELELVEEVDADNNDIEIQKEPEPVLPQITSIFGGIDDSSETLSKISLLTTQISNCANETILEDRHKTQNAISASISLNSDSSDELILADNANKDASESKAHDSKLCSELDIKPDISKSTWFGDLSNDIHFADDGIQLVDDGIAYVEDESAYQMPEIKCEIDIEEHEAIPEMMKEDEPKVDEKLLMVPVVNMVKLDDMGILPIHLLNHIDSKSLIDVIAFKSDLTKKKINISAPIEKEINASNPIKKEADGSESSDEEIIDAVKRVKLSSNLLQKPRSRTYNPIQLCKNPDFNTRLKKLNVGFFSSARNRWLLKACKPLSIDVSKAFECKLVNGTMYLEMEDSGDLQKGSEPEENSQNVSVLPSAMAVQSLIDNTRGYIPPVYHNILPKHVQAVSVTSKRNKVINLPDISEIRRINQKLLTAEVTPLQVNSGPTHVPVTLVKESDFEGNPRQHAYSKCGKRIAGPASRTKIMHPEVVDITTEENTGKDDSQTKNVAGNKDTLKITAKLAPWKPRHKPEAPWYSSKNNIYSDDTLLALDSLNKMLYLITEGHEGPSIPSGKSNKAKRSKALRKELALEKSHSNDDDNDDVQVICETKLGNTETEKSKRCQKSKTVHSSKNQKFLYCCWARERICQLIFKKKKPNKHNCPFPLCLCCCRSALVEFIKKKAKISKHKTPKDAVPLGGSDSKSTDVSTDDVTSVKENKDVSADVVEIIPIVETTPNVSVSGKEDKATEIDTVETAVNTDTVVNCNEFTKELVPIMTEETASFVSVGAEVSITSCENSVSLQKDPVTMDASTTIDASTDVNPLVQRKPRIRVKLAASTRKATECKPKRLKIQNSQAQQSRSHVLTESPEIVENKVNEDLAKPFRIREISPEKLPQSFDPTVPNILPKKYVNQKMIYLNSKQISELPSDNPIFLGKNKILLTTAVFPPNFKAFEAFQASIRQTLAVPKGIQLLLLPSGRLTYIRDRKINVCEEFLAALPQIIAAIQQQINSSITQPTQYNSQTEVIDLSDDEKPGTVENTERQSKVALSVDNEQTTNVDISPTKIDVVISNAEISHTENAMAISTANIPLTGDAIAISTTDISHTENAVAISTSDISHTENAVAISTADISHTENAVTISTADISSTKNTVAISTAIISHNVNTVAVSTAIISHTVSTVASSTADIPTLNMVETTNRESAANVDTPESATVPIETKENSGKLKNILSDLMVMSGIESTDVTPTNKECLSPVKTIDEIPIITVEGVSGQITNCEKEPIQTITHQISPPLLQPINTPLEQNSSLQLIHTSKYNDIVSKSKQYVKKVLTSSLTPITSLSELKYACAQNSSFFKLDLETGLLMPINVCMKKFTDTSQRIQHSDQKLRKVKIKSNLTEPKSVIDLTDDDVSEVTDISQVQPISKLTLNQDNELSRETANSNIQGTSNDEDGTSSASLDVICNVGIASTESLETYNCYINPSVAGKNVTEYGEVKPLKLFKSSVSRPTILERKLKEIQQRITENRKSQDMIRRKLKRKQELQYTIRVDYIDKTKKTQSSDDSSDEEPLAKIATKIRAAEQAEIENVKNVSAIPEAGERADLPTDSRVIMEVKHTNDLPDTISEHMDDGSNIDLPMEDDEDMEIQCLDETLLNEDEPEEDCILGV